MIATLTNPSSFTRNSVNVFTAPANTTLAANTNYYVEAAQTDGSGGLPTSSRTSFKGEDSGSSSGWGIGDRRFYRVNDTDGWTSSFSAVHQIQISGFAVNSAGDYTPPGLRTSEPPVVLVDFDSRRVYIKFDEALDRTNLPPADAFTVTVDGHRHAVTNVAVEGATT